VGDLVGEAVEGTLYYIAPEEFRRIREAAGDRVERTAAYADMCRLNALYMIARAGSGHIGSSFSSLDIVSWLLLDEMNATTSTSARRATTRRASTPHCWVSNACRSTCSTSCAGSTACPDTPTSRRPAS
jgi:hypothetical protein